MAVAQARAHVSSGLPISGVRVVSLDEAQKFAREAMEPDAFSSKPLGEFDKKDSHQKGSIQPLSIDTDLSEPDAGALFSPSLRAIRHYCQHHGNPETAPLTAVWQDHGFSFVDGPRRHSLDFSGPPGAPPGTLDRGSHTRSSKLGHLNQAGPSFPDLTSPKSAMALSAMPQLLSPSLADPQNAEGLSSHHQSQILNPLSPKLIGCLPYEYTHERLKQWGPTYHRNQSTADAFVKSVPLGSFQSPLSGTKIEGSPREESSMKVCVRVVPSGGTRNASLIHKSFSLRKIANSRRGKEFRTRSPIHKLSSRHETRSRSICGASASRGSHHHVSGSTPSSPAERLKSSFKQLQIDVADADTFAVHVEYALHRLPLLAAVLLSGHVLRGDTIELPLPHPAAWPETVKWMYIFDTKLTEGVKENVSYLAGNFEDSG